MNSELLRLINSSPEKLRRYIQSLEYGVDADLIQENYSLTEENELLKAALGIESKKPIDAETFKEGGFPKGELMVLSAGRNCGNNRNRPLQGAVS